MGLSIIEIFNALTRPWCADRCADRDAAPFERERPPARHGVAAISSAARKAGRARDVGAELVKPNATSVQSFCYHFRD
jgi:hypothetical protein